MSATTAGGLVTVTPEYYHRLLNLSRLARVPECAVGQRGCGKTAMKRSYADWVREQVKAKDPSKDVYYKYTNLSTADPVELTGLLMPDSASKTCSFYLRDDIPFVGNEKMPDAVIWMIDEIDNIQRAMESALLSITSEHMVGGVPLKPGCWITAAMNGRACNSLARDLSEPMKRRFLWTYFTNNVSAVAIYAKSKGWNKTVLDMYEERGEELCAEAPQFEDMAVSIRRDGTPDRPSFAQHEYYSRVMDVYEKHPGYFGPVLFVAMQGVLGLELASEEAYRIAVKGKVPTITEIANGTTLVPQQQHQHLLSVTFALMGSATRNGDAGKCAEYLKSCLDAGVSADIVRFGVLCLSKVYPRVWGMEWAQKFA